MNEHVLNVIVSWLRGMPPKSEREIPVEAVKTTCTLTIQNRRLNRCSRAMVAVMLPSIAFEHGVSFLLLSGVAIHITLEEFYMKTLNEKLESITLPDYCEVFAGYNTGEYYASCINGEGDYEICDIYGTDIYDCIKRSNPHLSEEDDEVADEVVRDYVEVLMDNVGAKYVVSRMYEENGKIFYNLDDTRVAVVEPRKISIVDMQDLHNEGFAFAKSDHNDSQVLLSSDKKVELVDKIGEIFGLDVESSVLMSVWLVAAFVPHILKPILFVDNNSVGTLTWTKCILQNIVDPVKGKPRYCSDESSHEMLAKRYLHFGYYIDDLDWLLWHNLNNEGLTGGDMGNMRNAMVTFDLTMQNFDADTLAKVLAIRPNTEHSTREEVAEAVISFEEERPYILQAIFEVLSEAMAIKDSINVEYAGVLTDFMQWSAAISFVLFGNKDVFSKAFVEHNPFGRSVNDWRDNYYQMIATKREKLLKA